MPFTLAHPAAVLPFLRQPFVPIALVAGAMAPDVPYFLKVPVTSGSWYEPLVNGSNSHDLAQILTVGFPLALLLAAVLWLVAQPVRWAVPDAWVPDKEATRGRRPSSARIALWTFYSLLLGLATHIVWDSFTHSYGWMVQQVPFLAAQPIAGVPIYRVLQHGSTVAGLVLLALWYRKRVKATPAPENAGNPKGAGLRLALLSLVLAIPALAVAGIAVVGELSTGAAFTPETFLWTTITRGGAALVVALVAYALVWHAVILAKKLHTAVGSAKQA
ncbi:DUF4184 family protein [Paeniglutamicibacter kerguelensis]|uniref:DUF4184 family protein n=1 Tax=Paeniglutamicibacter kerguelensis TaxID=254788 RepID=A0ABS4XGM5_9MICC|nr:DUF4184 family protein [Paeniglutamicibacter kerguelensis]MBP2387621.1 hypothetical protein [Paeniglutamicibacter kerguelensis]